jgi:hypothetical protein
MATPVPALKTFCAACVAATNDKTPGSISTMNGIGRQFYGEEDVCAQCGSSVCTLWFTLVHLPLVPLGSYRFLQTEGNFMKSRFLSRKLGAMRWGQVMRTWVIGWIAGAALITAIALWDQYKRGH